MRKFYDFPFDKANVFPVDKADGRLLSVQLRGKPPIATTPIDEIANLFSIVSIDSLLLEWNRAMLKKLSQRCGVLAEDQVSGNAATNDQITGINAVNVK